MEIINCTPYEITFCTDEGNIVIPQSGHVARACTSMVRVGAINGIHVAACEYGEIAGLPDKKAGTIYIVPAVVKRACPDRNDVFFPSGSVFDSGGKFIGFKYLVGNLVVTRF